MTVERLKEIAAEELAYAVGMMEKDGDLGMHFVLFHASGGRDLIFTEAAVANSEPAKAALARKIREQMREAGDVEAVVMVSDTWIAEMTREQEQIKRALGLTVKQAGDAGLCTIEEAIVVTLESPLYQQSTRQAYTREGDRIRLKGAPETLASEKDAAGNHGRFVGRFMTFFDRAESEARQ